MSHTIDKELIVRGLKELTRHAHETAKEAGWYGDNPGQPWNNVHRNVGEMLALIHSEISEALEGVRKNKQDDHLPNRKSVEVELADAVIRIADLMGYMGLDLGGALLEKMDYNLHREDHKRENRMKEGGKKF